MRVVIFKLLVLCALVTLAAAWSKEDHEIFRLKDEVAFGEGPEVTFYDFLGITQGASQSEIDKAYRKQARSMHPDKVKQSFLASRASQKNKSKKPGVNVNKPPSEKEIQKAVKQANDRFTRLGLVSQILRGSGRERYDHFLRNGFPSWRGTGYYYTRFRPGLGSVLVGLFIFGGGAVHYGILLMNYKRQRDFVGRYIRSARRMAWGNESAMAGIPGLDGSTAQAPPPEAEEPVPNGMNRRQKRAMEKENKKPKPVKKSASRSGTATPDRAEKPVGQRKKVTAENGKVLIVDQEGNVYLEQANEDGEVQEYLLDIDEIEKPTIRQTAVYRVPIWVFNKAFGRFLGKDGEQPEQEEVQDETHDVNNELATSPVNGNGNGNGNAKRRIKRTASSW